ncbi:O-methyltransferase [Sediminibacillus albus]|uniref:tRNA 5-hydroxyuridine methyltransferase n=1 Tax=Sediminibacillus albus TaxID=407036 RepID=A0A1G9CKY0_9BACI|nr:O-methyltransferase [Sediminibacillus albus]SDK52351.1 Predicted O-methyltransferase YrrM [Sediminibacillus albus]
MDEHLEQYLTGTLPANQEWVDKLEHYAQQHQIPIMEPLGIHFLMQLIRMKKPAKILEIGTAIGYSALRMLEAYPKAKVVTIERDEKRYREAVKNITALNKQNNIELIFGDALEEEEKIKSEGPYDLLFIDAAKGQYRRFFELYSEYLSEDGVVISDNVLFKGLVANQPENKDRTNKIATKIRSYNEWLVEHPNYQTTIIPIGDGIALTVRR